MKILITGSEGLIGSFLADAFRRAGHTISGLTRSDDPAKTLPATSPEAVVHAAGNLLGIGPARSAEGYFNNVSSTARVLEAAIGARARRFVFLSSNAVYGDGYAIRPGEEDRTDPKNWYGRSKLLCERMLRDQAGLIEGVILRLPSVLSPAKKTGDPLTDMAASLKAEGIVRVYGDGAPRRQFLDIRDLADIALHSCLCPLPGKEAAAVPAAGAEALTIKDLAGLLLRCAGRGRLEMDPGRPAGPDQWVDPSILPSRLGVRTRFRLEDSIRELLR